MGQKQCSMTVRDACNLGSCVEQVTGISSNSASPTDAWVIKFRPGTTTLNENGTKTAVDNAFLKYYITPSSWKELFLEMRGPDADYLNAGYKQLIGLNYEMLVYEYVIKPLIDRNICPHFIRAYNHSRYCNFESLVTMYPEPARIRRNITYLFNGWKNRPSINEPVEESADRTLQIYSFPVDRLQYSYILNQAIDPATTNTLQQFFQKVIATPTAEMKIKLVVSLFQCAYACYCLYLAGTAHNDLHDANVWITTRPTKKNVLYTAGTSSYGFRGIDICARIYDFDRAYCKSVGANYLLTGDDCADTSQCNYVANAKDFIKLICYLYGDMAEDWLIELFSGDIAYWKAVYADDCFLALAGTSIPEAAYMVRAYGYPRILENIYAKYVEFLGGVPATSRKFDMRYKVTPAMFGEKGKLLPA